MFGDAFRGRRVFVTGHTGFKGTWLTLWLLDLGADVTGYSLDPPSTPSLFAALGLERGSGSPKGEGRDASFARLTDLRGDVRDRACLRRALREAAPEMVFHLAAQPMVRRSYAEPHLTYETNVMGTVNLLDGIRGLVTDGLGPRVVVNVTSDKCYENLETMRPYIETDALGGFDPYSSSKGCADIVTQAYHRSFFCQEAAPRLASARAGNVIGGGDWGEDRLLPDCVRALSAGTKVELRNPHAVRPWQHVLESLSGYLRLASHLWAAPSKAAGPAPAAWNFGPGPDSQVTVREVVEQFLAVWGDGEWASAPGAGQSHEAGLLVLDSGKAERELGWTPAWGVKQAIEAAARWYRCFYDGAGHGVLLARCRADIEGYEQAAHDACAPLAVEEGSGERV